MSKRSFSRLKREKLVIYLTSGLVVGACGLTAFLVNRNQNMTDDGYVIDLADLDRYHGETEPAPEKTQEAGVVNSDSVVNKTTQIPAESEVAKELSTKQGIAAKNERNKAVTQKTATQKAAQGDPGHSEAAKSLPVKSEEPSVTTDSDSVTNDPNEAAASVARQTQADELPVMSEQEPLQFDAAQKMMWPLNGEVLIAYSMDQTIYFPTLDQYKYNPAIYIGGENAAPVCAAAKGVVKTIGVNEEIGQFVTMELGNGYETTYGQLQDVTVKEGDLVAKGQIIATLAAPTKYHSLEGPNLYFELAKDGQSIDPADYLE